MLESDLAELDAASELGRAYGNLGLIYLAQDKPKEAAKAYADAVEQLEGLGKRFPLYVDLKHVLAVARIGQGLNLTDAGQLDLALEPLERSRKLLEELVVGYSDVPAYRRDLARACATQGVYYLKANLPARALEPLQKAERLLQEVAKQSPDESLKRDQAAVEQNLEACHNRLARDAVDGKKWAKALPHVEAMGVVVGSESGLVVENLAFCLEVLLTNPPFGAARAAIERVPGDALRLDWLEIDEPVAA